MAINKVVYGNDTLIDLTGDNVQASDVRSGVSFHSPSGEPQVGTHEDSTMLDTVEDVESLTDGSDNYVVNAYTIKHYSNTFRSRVKVPYVANQTSLGLWISHSTPWTTAEETTNQWIGYNDADARDILTIPSSVDQDMVNISFGFDPSSGEPMILSGYQWDTSSGMICVRFGNIPTTSGYICIDIEYLRNFED